MSDKETKIARAIRLIETCANGGENELRHLTSGNIAHRQNTAISHFQNIRYWLDVLKKELDSHES